VGCLLLVWISSSNYQLSGSTGATDIQLHTGDNLPLTDVLRKDYDDKFTKCRARPKKRTEVRSVVTNILLHKEQYQKVEAFTSVPWYIVGIIHQMESGGDFTRHLHNGDSLKQRTVHEPKGRPLLGHPPFTWEQSAVDALHIDGFDVWKDWSIIGTLYKIENFNGMGYHARGVPSPYLWAGSTIYKSGKYVADGRFDPKAVSDQIGAALLLKELIKSGIIVDRKPGIRDSIHFTGMLSGVEIIK